MQYSCHKHGKSNQFSNTYILKFWTYQIQINNTSTNPLPGTESAHRAAYEVASETCQRWKEVWGIRDRLGLGSWEKKPLSSLSNQVMEKSLLSKCVAEIRQSCAFPIRPEGIVRSSKTTFQENLVKWTSCEERQPHVVDFVLLYMRGKHGVFTMAKVCYTGKKGRDHRKHWHSNVILWSPHLALYQ